MPAATMLIIRGKWRRRGIGGVGLALLSLIGWSIFFRPTAQTQYEAASAILDTELPGLAFQADTLQEALRRLDHFADGRLRVDWEALRDIGVERTTRVSLQVTNLQVREGLQRTLKAAGADLIGKMPNACCEFIDNGDILITTPDRLEIVERRYDVRPMRPWRLNDFEDPVSQDNPSDRVVYEALAMLVTDTVASDTWIENGGTIGSVRLESGWLIVRQTRSNHRAVARLMEQLVETRLDHSLTWPDRWKHP